MNIIEIFTKSLFLIISFDSDLWEIIILSLYVSISALIIASILGLLIGYYIALKKFFFKSFILIVLNSLMGIPPVVVGLIVYFMFASGGPFGVMQLLYTPTAMIIAQVIIIFPNLPTPFDVKGYNVAIKTCCINLFAISCWF